MLRKVVCRSHEQHLERLLGWCSVVTMHCISVATA